MRVFQKSVCKCLILLIVFYVFSTFLWLNIKHSLMNQYCINIGVTQHKTSNETVHIGIINTKSQKNLQLYLMLKSILLNRSTPLHLHILVDDFSRSAAKVLLDTWNIPRFKVSYYSDSVCNLKINSAKQDYDDKLLEIYKLILSKNIPSNVTDSIIVLNTNIIFNVDIYELWTKFNNNCNSFDIGKIYTTNVRTPKIKTLNADVTYFNLKRLRSFDCDLIYNYYFSNFENSVGQVDILHELTKSNYETVVLNCDIQLTEADSKEIDQIKVVQNISLYVNDKTLIDTIYKNVLQLDGNFLKNDMHKYSVSHNASNVTLAKRDMCQKLNSNIGLNRRVLLNCKEFYYNSSINDVTFSSQISFERIPLIERVATTWIGPLSITVYIKDNQLYNFTTFINNSKILKKRKNININLVFVEGAYYPINDLRNVSLRTVVTPYVYLIDMDVLPPSNLYEGLKRHIKAVGNMDKKALIVPAFQGDLKEIPKNKYELKKLLKLSKIKPFHQEFPPAYGPTNYKKWINAKHSYEVKYKMKYEPYVVVRSNVPEYDRNFIAFGFNKVSHLLLLAATNFSFIVLSDAFSVHKNHLASSGAVENKNSPLYVRCKIIKINKFIKDLNSKYHTNFTIKL